MTTPMPVQLAACNPEHFRHAILEIALWEYRYKQKQYFLVNKKPRPIIKDSMESIMIEGIETEVTQKTQGSLAGRNNIVGFF